MELSRREPPHSRAVVIEDSSDSDMTTSVSDSSVEVDRTKPASVAQLPVATSRWASGQVVKAYEVFCGSAGLTSALTKVGFEATGVDFKGNKDKPKGRCLWICARYVFGEW